MVEKNMMLAGLKKQSYLLARLIKDLERKPELSKNDFYHCGMQTRLVAGNLKKLRQIKRSYLIDESLINAF